MERTEKTTTVTQETRAAATANGEADHGHAHDVSSESKQSWRRLDGGVQKLSRSQIGPGLLWQCNAVQCVCNKDVELLQMPG